MVKERNEGQREEKKIVRWLSALRCLLEDQENPPHLQHRKTSGQGPTCLKPRLEVAGTFSSEEVASEMWSCRHGHGPFRCWMWLFKDLIWGRRRMSPLNSSQPLFTHRFLFLRPRWMTGQLCNNLCGCHCWGKNTHTGKETRCTCSRC